MMLAVMSNEALEWSSNNIVRRVMLHACTWASLYGKVFMSWTISTLRLWAGDLDMAKWILSDKVGLYMNLYPGLALMVLLG